MHDIEPFYLWRDYYQASEDKNSPFYGKEYSEFYFTDRIYNYLIHPQWDEIGSPTLYIKILIADYDNGFAIIECIGEWNDCLTNDIMFFKTRVADVLSRHGIFKFILLCDNVLNFHGPEDTCYYEEWFEELSEERGWVCFMNTLDHVTDEIQDTCIDKFAYFGDDYNEINWRKYTPSGLFKWVEKRIKTKQLLY